MKETTELRGKLIPSEAYNKSVALVEDIIAQKSEEQLFKMIGGYENDNHDFVENMIFETCNILTGSQSKYSKIVSNADGLDKDMIEAGRCGDSLFFMNTIYPELQINWHHYHWCELANLKKYIAVLASRDHGKSYFWSKVFAVWKMYRYNKDSSDQDILLCKKGFLFSHTDDKAHDYLEEIKADIEGIDALKDKLWVGSSSKWNKSEIKTKNGCSLKAKGFNASVRGYHPGWIICDDVLTEKVLYSPTQREKSKDYFRSVISNMIVPNGQMVVVGTPFHQQDLYSIFRDKDMKDVWSYHEYPAIYPDGKVLWKWRYDYEALKQKRKLNGSVIFSREFLCRPIASDSSLFPYEILKKAIAGMEPYTFINNIEASPIVFNSVVIGCDFALSANIGADYTVFTVWGIDEHENMWLLHCYRKQGATFNEQIGKIRQLNTNFRPNMVVMENNNFQQIYEQFLKDTAIPIKGHRTGTAKNDLKHGLPSLATLFERGKIKLPYGDEESKEMSELIMSEFNSVTFTDKGLQAVSGHDDTCMSTWFGRLAYMFNTEGGFDFMMI